MSLVLVVVVKNINIVVGEIEMEYDLKEKNKQVRAYFEQLKELL